MNKFLSIIEENKMKNRPICFFTLNDTLTKEGIRYAVKELYRGGFGGVYIHCRSGYTGNYLQEEWFEMCDELISTLNSLGMEAWVYDEFGWPSGIAGGNVLKRNENYCQKWLVKNTNPLQNRGEVVAYYNETENICDRENAVFSLEIIKNHSYVDVLNLDATEDFIRESHEKYRLRYGDKIKGFFTDEPQFGLESAPWNNEIADFLNEEYENAIEMLPSLFSEEVSGEGFRLCFHKKVAKTFIDNYVTPISSWCEKFGYKLTGHILEEKELYLQIPSAGDVMGIYKKMQTPGVDWLGAEIGDMKTPKQVSSICQRYAKSRSMTESFALIGYGASFDIMKNIVDWQIAGGISNVCNVMGYSIRGRRKRDYPAGFAFVQPYYGKLFKFNEYISRLCTIPATMKEVVDVLLVEPLYEGMKKHPYGKRFCLPTNCLAVSEKYNQTIKYLTENQILFHLASPSEIEFGEIEDGAFKLGEVSYNSVISLDEETDKILTAKGVRFENHPKNAKKSIVLTDGNKDVYASVYGYGDGVVAMLKNLSDSDVTLKSVCFNGVEYTAEVDFNQMNLIKADDLFIPAKGLKVVLFEDKGVKGYTQTEFKTVEIDNGDFDYLPMDKNLLVLDVCNYETDNEKGRISVINLFEKLISSGYIGKLKMQFTFENRGYKGEDCQLLVESPQYFDIYVNGEKAEFNGNVADISLKDGLNDVTVCCDYAQDETSRKILSGELGVEGDFNMLGKLFELENLYVSGNFGVFANDIKIQGKMAEATEFYIAPQKKKGGCNDAVINGYPYYCGKMIYQKEIDIANDERFISFKNICGVTDVYLDGELLKTVLWNEGKILIPDGVKGKHTLKIEHYNTIRNAVGPNHNIYDEGIMVGYTTFAQTPGWCDIQGKNMWTDTYRLAVFGVQFKGI